MIHMVGRLDARAQHSCVYVHMSRESRLMGHSRGHESSTTNTTRAYTTANRVCIALAESSAFFSNRMGGGGEAQCDVYAISIPSCVQADESEATPA